MSGILVATHGGSGADGAVRIGSRLAARLGTALHIVGAVEPTEVIDYGFGAMVVDAESEETVRSRIREQLHRVGIGGDETIDIVSGAPAAAIAATSQWLEVDLVVTGQGRRSLLDRTIGGETVLDLLQTSAVPMLTVAPDARALPRTIVAAVDHTTASLRATQVVAGWLVPGDALHLVHVRASAFLPDDLAGVSAESRLETYANSLNVPVGVRVDAAIITGDPARAILERAAGVQADLIALGSHGYGAWKRLALGSVSSKVIRHARRSVLVAPSGCVHHVRPVGRVGEARSVGEHVLTVG
ncbi:MAG TPA: universal stress protein [Gemmatimonadaceae bacterium]|nr:universal stress protein [Gemmatimonadaceae bacterium]